MARALSGGATEADLGLDVMRELVGRVLGPATPFGRGYRVRPGIA
ncbi:MAG TPA: hypothetical protein VFD49_07330 [Candidatus Dormibacteraeota bacterium]|nr:hypothetical protein [Candidatus Dormibacteraeota bacterium]